MDTDQALWDLEERVLGVVEEAMDIAYHVGVNDALDAVTSLTDVPPTEDEECPCGCGLTENEVEEQLLAAIAAQTSSDGADYWTQGQDLPDDPISDLEERLEAVEEYVGLKYTG